MKKVFRSALLLIACVSALAFAAQPAFATNLTNEYVKGGNTYNLAAQKTVTVATQAELTQLQALPAFAGFAQLQGTTTWINLQFATQLICSNNTLTVGWIFVGSQDYPDPGCATYAYIKAHSAQ